MSRDSDEEDAEEEEAPVGVISDEGSSLRSPVAEALNRLARPEVG